MTFNQKKEILILTITSVASHSAVSPWINRWLESMSAKQVWNKEDTCNKPFAFCRRIRLPSKQHSKSRNFAQIILICVSLLSIGRK